MHRIKHVEKPTNLITDGIQRIDLRDMAFLKATRGEYGPKVHEEMMRMYNAPKEPLRAALGNVLFHLEATPLIDVAARSPVPEDPAVLSRHIKGLGYFLGADIMGICQLPKSAVYSRDVGGNPIDIDYQFAITIVVRKDYRTVKASNGSDWIIDSVSYQSYQRTALIAHGMANYIRKLGYPALAQHGSRYYQVLMPPLLVWSGIGEVSRCGIILNPFLGLNFKAAAVLTDLPLSPDKPVDFGLQDFCQHCRICAEACPSQAISRGEKVMYNGYATWKLDERRCASFFIANQRGAGCNTCVKVCPWTRPNIWPHNLVRWAVSNSRLARRLAAKIDAGRGRPVPHDEEKWWFDLEEIDGLINIPAYDAQDNRKFNLE
jgi:ferredoxin